MDVEGRRRRRADDEEAQAASEAKLSQGDALMDGTQVEHTHTPTTWSEGGAGGIRRGGDQGGRRRLLQLRQSMWALWTPRFCKRHVSISDVSNHISRRHHRRRLRRLQDRAAASCRTINASNSHRPQGFLRDGLGQSTRACRS